MWPQVGLIAAREVAKIAAARVNVTLSPAVLGPWSRSYFEPFFPEDSLSSSAKTAQGQSGLDEQRTEVDESRQGISGLRLAASHLPATVRV